MSHEAAAEVPALMTTGKRGWPVPRFTHIHPAELQAAESNALPQENMARRAAGEEPLPEEEPGLFKPLPEPSQLDNVLLANQMDA
jgi:C-terminal region of eIF3h